MSIRIDPEFASLCRKLKPEERSLLEAGIDEEGCRDPLVVWQEHGVLLDGHNRKQICESLHKEYKTTRISLPNREAAIEWIIANQLGKRNLSDEEKSYLRGKRYANEKKKTPNEKGVNQHVEVESHDGTQPSTAEKLGAEYGVSKNTIKRDAKFADAVDKVAEVAPEIKSRILSGEVKATRKELQEVAMIAEPQKRKEAATLLASREPAERKRDRAEAKPESATDDCWPILQELVRITKSPQLKCPYSEIRQLITDLKVAYLRQHKPKEK